MLLWGQGEEASLRKLRLSLPKTGPVCATKYGSRFRHAPKPVERVFERPAENRLLMDNAAKRENDRRIAVEQFQYLSSPPVLKSIAEARYDITRKEESHELKNCLKRREIFS